MSDSGLRARFSPIPHQTSRRVLSRPLYLPALLDEAGLSEDGGQIDYETPRLGEYSVPAYGPQENHRKLRSADLSALTLYWDAAWLHESHQDPEWIKDGLYSILRSKQPVLLLLRLKQPGWAIEMVRMNVTFRTLTETIKPGEADTVYYAISIKEWRRSTVKRRGHGVGKVPLPTTHKLKASDTLESLSKHYYGAAYGWRAIAKANGIHHWGQRTPLVKMKRYKVGSKVKIPKKPAEPDAPAPQRGGTGTGTGGVAAPA